MPNSNATNLNTLQTIRDNLLSIINTEVAYQATNGPKPSYNLDGQGVDWNAWLDAMMKRVKDIEELIAAFGWKGGPVDGYVRA